MPGAISMIPTYSARWPQTRTESLWDGVRSKGYGIIPTLLPKSICTQLYQEFDNFSSSLENDRESIAAQTALRSAWVQWGGYTPMLVVVDAAGHWQQTGGANPDVIDEVLRIGRTDGRAVAAPGK